MIIIPQQLRIAQVFELSLHSTSRFKRTGRWCSHAHGHSWPFDSRGSQSSRTVWFHLEKGTKTVSRTS